MVYCHLDDAPGLHEPVKFAYVDSNRNPALANFMASGRKRCRDCLIDESPAG